MEQIDYISISCCCAESGIVEDVGTGWTEMRKK